MARSIHRLSNFSIERAKPKPGKTRALLCDGGGLWLQVTRSSSDPKELHKSWLFRWHEQVQTPRGEVKYKTREMGLGSFNTAGLSVARERALECRKLREAGLDPLAVRNAAKAEELSAKAKAKTTARAKVMTFDACARAYMDAHWESWKNAAHRRQWEQTLLDYASPLFGKLPVADINRQHILQLLDPLWNTKRETATRLRGRVERVLSWAAARGFRAGDNPARLDKELKEGLPKTKKVTAHHPAMPYREMHGFVKRLRERDDSTGLALEFLILTATRTSETLGARWDELDTKTGVWVIPPHRMKAGGEHEVPLSPRAIEIIHKMSALRQSDLIFPGRYGDKPMSNTTLYQLLRRMGHGDVTVHGFRSSFRDWAEEQTSFSRSVCERALAHAVEDKTEAAYLRTTLFEKRRALMAAWANYIDMPVSEGENVINLHDHVSA